MKKSIFLLFSLAILLFGFAGLDVIEKTASLFTASYMVIGIILCYYASLLILKEKEDKSLNK